MLRELHPDSLWVAEQPSKVMGLPFGARSTLVRLPDGGLWIHSPIALTDEFKSELESLGPVRAIVAPNKMHYAYFAAWAGDFPDAELFVAPDWKREVPARTPKVLSDEPETSWREVMQQSVLRGSGLVQELDFFHRASRTLILTDLIFNLSPQSAKEKLFANIIGIRSGPFPSRTFRWTADKSLLRASIEKILQWDFERIIIAHGAIVERDGPNVLRAAFAWLGQLTATATDLQRPVE